MRLIRQTTFSYAALLVLLAVAATGCRSSSRWASLNPWSKDAQETSLAARSAPALPSQSATNPGGGATSVASADGGEAPAFQPSTETLASAPVASYPNTSAGAASASGAAGPYPTTAPDTKPSAAGASASPTSPLASAPPAGSAGPYDTSGRTAPPATRTASATAPSGAGRYGSSGSRYQASDSLPSGIPSGPTDGYASTSAADDRSTPPGAAASPPTSRYGAATPGLPPASPAGAAGAPQDDRYAAGAPASSNATAGGEEAPITTDPGGYRPGGTSDYSVSVASRTTPSGEDHRQPGGSAPSYYPTAPSTPTGQTPSAGAPSYPSTPSYR